MRVYAVVGGWDYEGTDFDSLRLFDCRSTAEEYELELQRGLYDYSRLEVREVCMQSTYSDTMERIADLVFSA